MATTNCTANTSRRSLYALGISGGNAVSKLISARSWGLKQTTTYAKDEGPNGTLWDDDSNYAIDKTSAAGPIDFVPRPDHFRWLLPLIFGGTFSTNDLKPAPICAFYKAARYDRTLDKVFLYNDCVTSTASFSSSSSAPVLAINMAIEAKTRTRGAANTWPSGMTLSALQPFVHSSSTLQLDSNSIRVDDIKIDVDNMLITDSFFNSQTRGICLRMVRRLL